MRRRGGLVLLVGLLGGCALPEPDRPTDWLRRFQPAAALGPNVVFMDVALVERPAGDDFLNRELWSYTDEQVVALDRQAALERNGFRVGQLVGIPPDKFQKLLTSERSCANPQRCYVQPGNVAAQKLGPLLSSLSFEAGGEAAAEALDQAQCFLDVVPTLTNDERTRLRFSPRVEHGEVQLDIRPDPAGWTAKLQRSARTFPDLTWEVVVAPNEYVVIGARLDRPRSLAYATLVEDAGDAPVQRLLVLRTNRSRGEDEDERTPTLEDLARRGKSVPLALQATLTSARACAP